MNDREVMQQALEALEEATTYTSSPSWSPSMTSECNAAITALRTALAEQDHPLKLAENMAEQIKIVAYLEIVKIELMQEHAENTRRTTMNNLRTAAQQALEAIDRALPYAPHRGEFDAVADTADDLRAALAEKEPVEWLTGCPECGMDGGCDCPSEADNTPQRDAQDLIPPDALFVCGQMGAHVTRVRLAEPQREPLTDEQIDAACVEFELWNTPLTVYDRRIARAIEQAHGIKEQP